MFHIFYCCYSTGIEASDDDMVDVKSKERLLDFALDVLRDRKDFFGIVDSQEVTLQFWVEDSGELWVEIPFPELGGSYGKRVNRTELPQIIEGLRLPFSKTMIPGLVFTSWS